MKDIIAVHIAETSSGVLHRAFMLGKDEAKLQ